MKILNTVMKPEKPKSVSKGSNAGSTGEAKSSKHNPNFSKIKNKTDSVPLMQVKKVEQVLTLDQFEEDDLPVSPTKSVKIQLKASEKVDDSIP